MSGGEAAAKEIQQAERKLPADEAKRKMEEERQKAAELEAERKRQADEAKRKVEEERQKAAELEAERQRQTDEAKRKVEEERQKAAELEAERQRKADEAKRKAEEERQKAAELEAEKERFKSENKWKVMYVKGTIKVKSSGEVLKVGSQINIGDKLLFETPEAFADVFSFSKGREVLRKPEPKSKQVSEWISFVRDYLSPAKMVTTAGRSGYISNIFALKNNFAKPAYLVLGGTREVKINIPDYPMSDTNFFYVRYDYQGESINKKLDFREDTLIISKRTLFMIDNKAVDAMLANNFHLYYYNATKETYEFITRFNPKFPDDYELEKQLGVIVQISKESGKLDKDIIKEAKAFLNERYGHFSEDNFSSWFCKPFQICH